GGEWKFLFFQAEDGIRDFHVTGVQTCALPIFDLKKLVDELIERDIQLPVLIRFTDILEHRMGLLHDAFAKAIEEQDYKGQYRCEIGRASCRERGESSESAET